MLRLPFRTFAMMVMILPAGFALAGGPHYTPWSDAQEAASINNSVNGGCPIESRDGLTIYMASGRPDGSGGLDIWRASRADKSDPFGPAENLPMPVNSASDDFCPTPVGGKYLFFVSRRGGEGTCGGGDMYITRENPAYGWEDPVNLGCADLGEGPNSAVEEFSPSLVETDEGLQLYYSSNRGGNQDIYMSVLQPDGNFSPGTPVVELNTDVEDQMPNVSKDGREIVFSSTREGGSQDVFTAHRDSTTDPWSTPVKLGPGINTEDGAETRASLSWDGTRLYFGRGGEIFVSEREKIKGKKP